jgi:hypothetical protein
VSATAHRPGDLVRGLHWKAMDTRTDLVAEALARLLREAEHLGGEHVSLRTMNLLVAPHTGPVAPIPHDGGSREEMALHPARMIRLTAHGPDRLDGEVRVRLIRVGEAQMEVLVEDVHLRASDDRLGHAQSLIAPLLARGIPTVAWLPGCDHGRVADALAQTAHVTVFDSDRDPDAARALGFAHATALAHPSRDLAWLRTRSWRQRISAAFADETARSLLAFAPSAHVVGDPARPSALLFAAWIAARADVNVSLSPGTGAEPVEAVTIAGRAIAPRAGGACDAALLSQALDTVYSAPRGYEDALGALGRVVLTP